MLPTPTKVSRGIWWWYVWFDEYLTKVHMHGDLTVTRKNLPTVS